MMDQQNDDAYKNIDTQLSQEEFHIHMQCKTPKTFINLPKDEQTEEDKLKFGWMNGHDYDIHLQLGGSHHNQNISTQIEEKK